MSNINSYWNADSIESKVDALLNTNGHLDSFSTNSGNNDSPSSSNRNTASTSHTNNQGVGVTHSSSRSGSPEYNDQQQAHSQAVQQQMHLSNVTSPMGMISDLDSNHGDAASVNMANTLANDIPSANSSALALKSSSQVLARPSRPLNPSKRAQQNRVAQRSFRQRKEAYIKDLELKVNELKATKDTIEALRQENLQLRDYILALQSRLIEHPGGFPTPPAVYSRQSGITSAGGPTSGSGQGSVGGESLIDQNDEPGAEMSHHQEENQQQSMYDPTAQSAHHMRNIQLQALSHAALGPKFEKV